MHDGHRHESIEGSNKQEDANRGNMTQLELFSETENLFEQLATTETLRLGFKAVKANRGKPGIDRISTKEYESRLDEELEQLRAELTSWTYKPKPVRRVEIPKPDGGVRLLGVPCIRDRVVQAALQLLLEPIFDPHFSESSYGFRPKRDQEKAVKAAQKIVNSGKDQVVDIDLSKFFDRINHDRLLERMKLRMDDKRILRLVGMTLRSGVMTRGAFERTEEGTTQGSPLSPLLSNIVLDELDKELERRGLEFCRFADDVNVFVRSRRAGKRVMEGITSFIEKRMKLVVNQDKSRVAPSRYVKFLGLTIFMGAIVISNKAMERAMEKVKTLIPRRAHKTLEASIEEINRWYRGWSNYYKITHYPAQLHYIEAHIRRRLRVRLIRNMKRRRTIAKNFIKMGVKSRTAYKTVYSNQGWWKLSRSYAANKTFSNKWFEDQGLYIRSDHQYSHWFDVKIWIKIT
jgi:RNA-directed DNA polymerase